MDDQDHSIVEYNNQCLQDNCYVQVLNSMDLSFLQLLLKGHYIYSFSWIVMNTIH